MDHVTTTLSRISSRHPVRRIAESLLESKQVGSEEINVLLSVLQDSADSRWRHRIAAAWALQQVTLTSEQKKACLQFLCDRLQRGKRFEQQAFRTAKQILGVMAPVGVLMAYLFMWMYEPNLGRFGEIFLPLFLVSLLFASPFLFPMFLSLQNGRDAQCRVAFIELLEHLHEPLSVGALAAAVCDFSSEISEAAKHALLEVLPDLTSEHYGQLPSDTIPNLCKVLEAFSYPPAPLIHAILDAFEKVGDSRAIFVVKSIADGRLSISPVCTGTGDEANRQLHSIKSCRRKAQRILPILLERQEREKHSSILLRASAAPEATPEELLRPAATGEGTASEQLLRAASTNESE